MSCVTHGTQVSHKLRTSLTGKSRAVTTRYIGARDWSEGLSHKVATIRRAAKSQIIFLMFVLESGGDPLCFMPGAAA